MRKIYVLNDPDFKPVEFDGFGRVRLTGVNVTEIAL